MRKSTSFSFIKISYLVTSRVVLSFLFNSHFYYICMKKVSIYIPKMSYLISLYTCLYLCFWLLSFYLDNFHYLLLSTINLFDLYVIIPLHNILLPIIHVCLSLGILQVLMTSTWLYQAIFITLQSDKNKHANINVGNKYSFCKINLILCQYYWNKYQKKYDVMNIAWYIHLLVMRTWKIPSDNQTWIIGNKISCSGMITYKSNKLMVDNNK